MSTATTQAFRGQVEDNADRTAQNVNEAANAASAAVREASRKVTAAVSDIGDRASTATHDLTRRVEQQPLSSVAIALGAGFVLGMLLGRR